jgi:hypothetical protein
LNIFWYIHTFAARAAFKTMADGQGFVLKDDYRRRERNELGGCHCPNIWALFLMFIENDFGKPEIVEDKKKNSMTVTRRFSASWWMLNMLLIRREDA